MLVLVWCRFQCGGPGSHNFLHIELLERLDGGVDLLLLPVISTVTESVDASTAARLIGALAVGLLAADLSARVPADDLAFGVP